MTRVTPQQYMQKWASGLNGATSYITQGVNNVKVAPGIAAAAAQATMLANLTASVTSGKWAANTSAVSLPAWQASMINKGIPHLAAGINVATTAKLPQITKLLSNVDQAVQSLSATPRGGLQQNIQRAVSFMNSMSTLSQQS